MSKFEKIILPLTGYINKEDISSDTGFIDCYTSDPDRPSGSCELFLVYKEDVRTDSSIHRARKFEKCEFVKRKYVKYVDNIPYLVYSFWVTPNLKQLYKGVFTTTTRQKSEILQFWGVDDDIVDFVMTNSVVSTSSSHPMPIADYQKTVMDANNLFVVNK